MPDRGSAVARGEPIPLAEAAHRAGMHPNHLRRLVERGELTALVVKRGAAETWLVDPAVLLERQASSRSTPPSPAVGGTASGGVPPRDNVWKHELQPIDAPREAVAEPGERPDADLQTPPMEAHGSDLPPEEMLAEEIPATEAPQVAARQAEPSSVSPLPAVVDLSMDRAQALERYTHGLLAPLVDLLREREAAIERREAMVRHQAERIGRLEREVELLRVQLARAGRATWSTPVTPEPPLAAPEPPAEDPRSAEPMSAAVPPTPGVPAPEQPAAPPTPPSVELLPQADQLPATVEPDTLVDTATESPAEGASVAAELAAGVEAPDLESAAPEAPQEEPSVFERQDATSGPSAQEETDYVASVQESVPPASDAPTLDMADPMVETALTLSEQVAQMRDNLRILAARLQDAAAVNPGVAALGAEVDLAFGAAGALLSSPAMGEVPSAAVPVQPGGEPPGVLEGEVEEAAAQDGAALEAAINAAGSGEAATQATAEPTSPTGAPDAGEAATPGPATPPPAADPFAEAETAIRELQQALANRAGRGPNGPVETAPPTPEPAPDPTGDRLSTQSSSTAPAPGATTLNEPVISPAEAEALRAMRALQSAQRREERRPWWRIW